MVWAFGDGICCLCLIFTFIQASGTHQNSDDFRVIAWRHQQELSATGCSGLAQQLRCCCVLLLQELLCDRSRDNAQIEAELKAVLSEEPTTNARQHLHAPAAREALVARLKQVQHLGTMLGYSLPRLCKAALALQNSTVRTPTPVA